MLIDLQGSMDIWNWLSGLRGTPQSAPFDARNGVRCRDGERCKCVYKNVDKRQKKYWDRSSSRHRHRHNNVYIKKSEAEIEIN